MTERMNRTWLHGATVLSGFLLMLLGIAELLSLLRLIPLGPCELGDMFGGCYELAQGIVWFTALDLLSGTIIFVGALGVSGRMQHLVSPLMLMAAAYSVVRWGASSFSSSGSYEIEIPLMKLTFCLLSLAALFGSWGWVLSRPTRRGLWEVVSSGLAIALTGVIGFVTLLQDLLRWGFPRELGFSYLWQWVQREWLGILGVLAFIVVGAVVVLGAWRCRSGLTPKRLWLFLMSAAALGYTGWWAALLGVLLFQRVIDLPKDFIGLLILVVSLGIGIWVLVGVWRLARSEDIGLVGTQMGVRWGWLKGAAVLGGFLITIHGLVEVVHVAFGSDSSYVLPALAWPDLVSGLIIFVGGLLWGSGSRRLVASFMLLAAAFTFIRSNIDWANLQICSSTECFYSFYDYERPLLYLTLFCVSVVALMSGWRLWWGKATPFAPGFWEAIDSGSVIALMGVLPLAQQLYSFFHYHYRDLYWQVFLVSVWLTAGATLWLGAYRLRDPSAKKHLWGLLMLLAAVGFTGFNSWVIIEVGSQGWVEEFMLLLFDIVILSIGLVGVIGTVRLWRAHATLS